MQDHGLNPLRAAAILAVAFAASSCSKLDHHPISPELGDTVPAVTTTRQEPKEAFPAGPFSPAQKRMMESQVSCNQPQYDCENGVGMIVSAMDDQTVRRCTVFLITNDIAMTSVDCLPEDLRQAGKKCIGRVQLFFPEHLTGVSPVNGTNCARVMGVSAPLKPGIAVAPQLALLRLNESVRRWVLPAGRGPTAMPASLTLARVDAVEGTTNQGIIQVQDCQISSSSLALPFPTSQGPFVTATGCSAQTEAGEGAPLLDSDGTIRAVLSGPVPLETRYHTLGLFGVAPPSSSGLSDLYWAATFHCLKSSEPGCADQISESDLSDDGILQRAKVHFGSLLRRVRQDIAKWNETSDAGSIFRWKEGAIGIDSTELHVGDSFWLSVPSCFHPTSEGWQNAFKDWFGNYDDEASVTMTLPLWKISFQLSLDMTMKEQATQLEPISVEIHFNVDEMTQQKPTPVSLKFMDPVTRQSRTITTAAISACPD